MSIFNVGSANVGASQAARIGRLKGEILAHAVPVEVLGITGVQKKMPLYAILGLSLAGTLPVASFVAERRMMRRYG